MPKGLLATEQVSSRRRAHCLPLRRWRGGRLQVGFWWQRWWWWRTFKRSPLPVRGGVVSATAVWCAHQLARQRIMSPRISIILCAAERNFAGMSRGHVDFHSKEGTAFMGSPPQRPGDGVGRLAVLE